MKHGDINNAGYKLKIKSEVLRQVYSKSMRM